MKSPIRLILLLVLVFIIIYLTTDMGPLDVRDWVAGKLGITPEQLIHTLLLFSVAYWLIKGFHWLMDEPWETWATFGGVGVLLAGVISAYPPFGYQTRRDVEPPADVDTTTEVTPVQTPPGGGELTMPMDKEECPAGEHPYNLGQVYYYCVPDLH